MAPEMDTGKNAHRNLRLRCFARRKSVAGAWNRHRRKLHDTVTAAWSMKKKKTGSWSRISLCADILFQLNRPATKNVERITSLQEALESPIRRYATHSTSMLNFKSQRYTQNVSCPDSLAKNFQISCRSTGKTQTCQICTTE